jgi:hypothetical protein
MFGTLVRILIGSAPEGVPLQERVAAFLIDHDFVTKAEPMHRTRWKPSRLMVVGKTRA